MSQSEPDVTLTALVTERVQRVGFRQFVYERARHLRLIGWVCNCTDGSVEVVAHGPRAAIDALRAMLRQGPRPALVAAVHEDFAPRADLPATFEFR